MIHFHGTPITPKAVLESLHGNHFCVSHARPDQIEICHKIGQQVLIDNGAFQKSKRGQDRDWKPYFAFCEYWFGYAATRGVVPDVIDGGTQLQDALLREWPFGKHRGWPVWHMDEPIERLLRLIEGGWAVVCIGSTAEYWVVGSDAWMRRMDEIWNVIVSRFGIIPAIHMLRGMQCCEWGFPFYSMDSSDVAQNHHRSGSARKKADAWNAQNGPRGWTPRPIQLEMIA